MLLLFVKQINYIYNFNIKSNLIVNWLLNENISRNKKYFTHQTR